MLSWKYWHHDSDTGSFDGDRDSTSAEHLMKTLIEGECENIWMKTRFPPLVIMVEAIRAILTTSWVDRLMSVRSYLL